MSAVYFVTSHDCRRYIHTNAALIAKGISAYALLDALVKLPPRSIVLCTTLFQDGAGQLFGPLVGITIEGSEELEVSAHARLASRADKPARADAHQKSETTCRVSEAAGSTPAAQTISAPQMIRDAVQGSQCLSEQLAATRFSPTSPPEGILTTAEAP